MGNPLAPSALLTGLRFAGCLPHAAEPPRQPRRKRQSGTPRKARPAAAPYTKEEKKL